jgi:hypothetical protein
MAILRIEPLRSQRRLLPLLPLDVGTAAFAASSHVPWQSPDRDFPELRPLVDLAIPRRIFSHEISVSLNESLRNHTPVVQALRP